MFRRQMADDRPLSALAIIAGLIAIGLLGAALYVSPNESTIAIVAVGLGLPLLALLWSRPEVGLLLLILCTSGLVPVEIVDLRLPIGGGLDARDLVLLGMLGLLAARGLLNGRLALPWPAVGLPLLMFLGLAFFSAVYALLYLGVERTWALAELRSEGFFLTFFVAGWAITRRDQLAVTIAGLFVIADLTAAIVILQQFLGANHPLLEVMSSSNWHLWQQETLSSGFGAVRIVPPGHVLMYFIMLVSICLMVFTTKKAHLRGIYLVQFAYLNIALLLTYTRAQWIAAIVAIGLIVVVLLRNHSARVFQYVLAGSAVLLLSYGLLGAQLEDRLQRLPFVYTLRDRALSVFSPSDTLQSYSLEWRRFEAEEALRSIAEHPLLGIGLGNPYRGITTLQGEAMGAFSVDGLAAGDISRLTRFIHSSPLSIAVKMGLPALLVFLWFSATFLISGWCLHQRLSDSFLKATVLAMLAGYVGLLPWSLFHELFVVVSGTVFVGMATGLVASIQDTDGYALEAQLLDGIVPATARKGIAHR